MQPTFASRKNLLLQLVGALTVDSFVLSAPSGTVSAAESCPIQAHTPSWGDPWVTTKQRGYIKAWSSQANSGQLQRNIPSPGLPRLTLYNTFTLPMAHSCLLPFPSRGVSESLAACSALSKSISWEDLPVTISHHLLVYLKVLGQGCTFNSN